MRLYSIFIAFSILFASVTDIYAANKTPTSNEVKKELKSLLEKRSIKDVETYKKRLRTPTLLQIPPLIKKVIIYFILISLFVGLIIGIYYIIKPASPILRKNKTIKKEDIEENEISRSNMPPFKELYQKAIDLAENGNFNKAVILLHWATIEYLSEALIIQRNKEYTNNDLKRVVKKQNGLFDPFCSIAKYAEIAAFSNMHLSGKDFSVAQQKFEKTFF